MANDLFLDKLYNQHIGFIGYGELDTFQQLHGNLYTCHIFYLENLKQDPIYLAKLLLKNQAKIKIFFINGLKLLVVRL